MDPEIHALAERLAASPDHRVLRRVRFPTGVVQLTAPAQTPEVLYTAAVVDVETTGLDIERDRIIELAIRRIRHDAEGRVHRLDRLHVWREDPGVPIPEAVSRITGIRDADVAGTRIPDEKVVGLLSTCERIVAHHAAFDRPHLERRLPSIADKAWGCSLLDIDWPSTGLEGRSLGWIAAQCGWFFDAHRAAGDVDALVTILRHAPPGAATLLSSLLEGMDRDGWRVVAEGAPFASKDALKARGYRWHAGLGAWWREIRHDELDAERGWLATAAYIPGAGARASGPRVDRVTANERHRPFQ